MPLMDWPYDRPYNGRTYDVPGRASASSRSRKTRTPSTIGSLSYRTGSRELRNRVPTE